MSKETKIVGPWELVRCCVQCGADHIEAVHYSSYGICPYCRLESGSRFTEVEKWERRLVITNIPKWWEFWKKEKFYWEYREYEDADDDDESATCA